MTWPRRKPSSIGLSLIVLAGCAEGRSAKTEPVRATVTETVRIGSVDDPETAITLLNAAVVADDGGIYSAHPRDSQIRAYDAAGRLLHTIGRKGSGPGEFEGLQTIGLHGDSLWAYDSQLARFSYFDPRTGALLTTRDIRVELGSADGTVQPPRPNGLLADGTPWGSPPAFSHLVASGQMTHTTAIRVGWDGAARDTIGTWSIEHSTWQLAYENGASYIAQPYDDDDIVIVSSTRDELVRVDRAAAPPGTRAEFRVSRIALDGDTIWSRAYAYSPVPIRDETVDSLVNNFAGLLEQLSFPGVPAGARRREIARESFYRPAAMPPVTAAVQAADGTIWVERETTGEATSNWWILREDETQPIMVSLPAKARVLAATRDAVWVSIRDELDVPFLVKYQLGILVGSEPQED